MIRLINLKTVLITSTLFMFGCSIIKVPKESDKEQFMKICENIATDIELLKEEFPQLKEFKSAINLNNEKCKIIYEFKCHKSDQRAGWVGGVPNPEPEGIWFYIGIWDENDPEESQAQINTQPFLPLWYIDKRRVTFLILEGESTKKVNEKIIEIMKRHGLVKK